MPVVSPQCQAVIPPFLIMFIGYAVHLLLLLCAYCWTLVKIDLKAPEDPENDLDVALEEIEAENDNLTLQAPPNETNQPERPEGDEGEHQIEGQPQPEPPNRHENDREVSQVERIAHRPGDPYDEELDWEGDCDKACVICCRRVFRKPSTISRTQFNLQFVVGGLMLLMAFIQFIVDCKLFHDSLQVGDVLEDVPEACLVGGDLNFKYQVCEADETSAWVARENNDQNLEETCYALGYSRVNETLTSNGECDCNFNAFPYDAASIFRCEEFIGADVKSSFGWRNYECLGIILMNSSNVRLLMCAFFLSIAIQVWEDSAEDDDDARSAWGWQTPLQAAGMFHFVILVPLLWTHLMPGWFIYIWTIIVGAVALAFAMTLAGLPMIPLIYCMQNDDEVVEKTPAIFFCWWFGSMMMFGEAILLFHSIFDIVINFYDGVGYIDSITNAIIDRISMEEYFERIFNDGWAFLHFILTIV